MPATAELVMRSRYSAFLCGDRNYLLSTWHPLTRPDSLELDDEVHWRQLDIVRTVNGGLLHNDGIVEFTAHYEYDGVVHQQHETSRFLKIDRRWYYLEAVPEG